MQKRLFEIRDINITFLAETILPIVKRNRLRLNRLQQVISN